MLNENDVVKAVCSYLEGAGYKILRRCSTTNQGIDIIAKHPSEVGSLWVEAKGGISAREGSARFEKGFNRSQVFDRVAKCLYTAAQMHAKSADGESVAMAFPDTPLFRDYLSRIRTVTDKLGFRVFLASEDSSVQKL
jgi:Holliday junction resolvase-like predicted endonuclease